MNDGYTKLANNGHTAVDDHPVSHAGQALTKAAPEQITSSFYFGALYLKVIVSL